VAHFARIADGIVTGVYAVSNDVATDEAAGQEFLAGLLGGDPSEYVQTSYSGATRGGYAGPGHRWDGKDFAAPEPTITVTAQALTDAGLDARTIKELSKS